jgi:hypothetical protein
MMVPKKSLILAGAALAVLGASASAQSIKTNKQYRRAGGAREATLDLSTGTYTRGPAVNNRGGVTIADFTNIDAFDGAGFGWLVLETGGGVCRWFSAGAKGTGPNQTSNASDMMSDFVFFYCTSAADVNSGGLGGSVTIGFYEGYTVTGGAPTTTVVTVGISQMPGNTVDGDPTVISGAGCFGLRVTFDPMITTFQDQTFIGYSWQFDDLGSVSGLAKTFPFLSCVVSCSGLNILTKGTAGGVGGPLGLGEDGQGMIDVIDQFCTNPVRAASFSFGTTATQWAPTTRVSVNMRINEAADLATTNVNYNATLTPNGDTLSASKATLGQTWTVTLTRSPVTVAGVFIVNVKKGRFPGNGGNPTPPVQGRVLIAGVPLTGLPSTPHNGTTGTVAQSVPLTFAFCGLHLAAQARSTGGGIKLSSGVEGTVGTF